MIPNRFLFVWSGRAFPYAAALAVESVLLREPEAAVEIHLFGDRPDGVPAFERLRRRARVSVHAVDLRACFDGLDAPAQRYLDLLAAVPARDVSARSNVVRYALLLRRGGVYLDFDVLVVRSFETVRRLSAFVGRERVWRVNEARVAGRVERWMVWPTLAYGAAYALRRIDTHLLAGRDVLEGVAGAIDPVWSTWKLNNAVLGAEPGHPLLRRLLAAALERDPRIRFNLGPTLVDAVVRDDPGLATVLPDTHFYPEPPSYSFRYFHGRRRELLPDTLLVHYVASNHRRRLRALTPQTLRAGRGGGLFYALARAVAEGRAAGGL